MKTTILAVALASIGIHHQAFSDDASPPSGGQASRADVQSANGVSNSIANSRGPIANWPPSKGRRHANGGSWKISARRATKMEDELAGKRKAYDITALWNGRGFQVEKIKFSDPDNDWFPTSEFSSTFTSSSPSRLAPAPAQPQKENP